MASNIKIMQKWTEMVMKKAPEHVAILLGAAPEVISLIDWAVQHGHIASIKGNETKKQGKPIVSKDKPFLKHFYVSRLPKWSDKVKSKLGKKFIGKHQSSADWFTTREESLKQSIAISVLIPIHWENKETVKALSKAHNIVKSLLVLIPSDFVGKTVLCKGLENAGIDHLVVKDETDANKALEDFSEYIRETHKEAPTSEGTEAAKPNEDEKTPPIEKLRIEDEKMETDAREKQPEKPQPKTAAKTVKESLPPKVNTRSAKPKN